MGNNNKIQSCIESSKGLKLRISKNKCALLVDFVYALLF